MKISVVFLYGTSLLSRLVRFFSRGRFSHCGFKISNSLIDIDAFRSVEVSLFHYKENEYEEIEYELTLEQYRKLKSYINSNKNKEYDYIELVRYFFSFIPDDRRKKNCVEFVIDGLKKIDILDIENKSYSPEQLYKILKG